MAERIVAIGDLHGDLEKTRAAFRLAGVINEDDQWIGGSTVVVQTGDQLDRGDDEFEILDLLDALAAQAPSSGGAVHVLNGNHELMNVKQDLRYVTLGGFLDFLPTPVADPERVEPQVVVDAVHERLKACRPGKAFALRLLDRNVVTIIGDTVFVHGGVLPHVVDYGIERLNQESRDWIRADRPYPPDILLAKDGPVWSRHYSDDPDAERLPPPRGKPRSPRRPPDGGRPHRAGRGDLFGVRRHGVEGRRRLGPSLRRCTGSSGASGRQGKGPLGRASVDPGTRLFIGGG